MEWNSQRKRYWYSVPVSVVWQQRNLLENAGAEVVLFDGNEKLDKAHVLENFTESKTPELYVGVLPEEVEKELDLVVLSPGVPVDLPLVPAVKRGRSSDLG